MDAEQFEIETAIERDHWWFVGRRRLFRDVIARLGLDRGAAVLDVGTGSGSNLRLLGEMGFADFAGLDHHDAAIYWCERKNLGHVHKGDITGIPFADGSFDLVLATDVIEHVDDDMAALREIRRILKPGGRALITVPAFPALWGLQDDVTGHRRRYGRGELPRKLEQAGLARLESFYFNFLLFLPILLARRLIRLLGLRLKSENQLTAGPLNRLLGWVFTLDILAARHVRAPFGVSYLCVVRRA